MMPNILGRAGREYDGGQASTDTATYVITGHPEVVELWRDYTTPGCRENGWTFYRRAIRLAMTLFSTQENFFKAADRNPSIHGYNYEFIMDTVRFIVTGQRNISVHMWPDLVNHSDEGMIDVDRRHTMLDFLKGYSSSMDQSTTGLIQRWIAQPDGINDLIHSLNILFGDITTRS